MFVESSRTTLEYLEKLSRTIVELSLEDNLVDYIFQLCFLTNTSFENRILFIYKRADVPFFQSRMVGGGRASEETSNQRLETSSSRIYLFHSCIYTYKNLKVKNVLRYLKRSNKKWVVIKPIDLPFVRANLSEKFLTSRKWQTDKFTRV